MMIFPVQRPRLFFSRDPVFVCQHEAGDGETKKSNLFPFAAHFIVMIHFVASQ